MIALVTPLFLSLAFTLGSYFKDETVTGYLPADGPWVLEEINGSATDAGISLMFSPDRLTLTGPCLRLSAGQSAPYPWFEATGVDDSANACPLSPVESAVNEYLAKMNLAEVSGDVLILSQSDGGGMVFRLSQ